MSLLSFMGLGSALGSMIPGVGKVASGMLSTLGGGLFNLGQNDFNSSEAAKNRQFQRDERLSAQQFNLDMWNLNNEYNSPVEQLKRAQAAGINPNDAINGMKGATSQPVTTTPMSGNMASSSGSIAANLLTQDAMLKNLLANTKKTEKETESMDFQLTYDKSTASERFNALVKQNKKYDAEINKLITDKDIQEKTYLWFSKKSEEEINLMSEQLNLLKNQSSEILQNIELKKAQTEGQKISNELESVKKRFSEITGMPFGSNEFDVMFSLWRQNKASELLSFMTMKAEQNLSSLSVSTLPTAIPGLIGVGGSLIGEGVNKISPYVKEAFDGVKNYFTPFFGEIKDNYNYYSRRFRRRYNL